MAVAVIEQLPTWLALCNQNIQAFAVMAEGSYTLADVALRPRLGLRANVFSGDGDLANGTAGTFVPPFRGCRSSARRRNSTCPI